MDESPYILETMGLTKSFGALVAVEGVDFRLPEGELRAIIGPNGAGKSSLLDAITWSLWGKARSNTADDLIHQGEDEMRVALTFDQGGERYQVLRQRKAGKRGASLLEFQHWDDEVGSWRSLSESTIRQTQQAIDSLLARQRLADLIGVEVDDTKLPDRSAPDPESALAASEMGGALSRAVAKLSAQDRLLLAFRFEHDATSRDVSDVMGFPSRFHAYRKLKSEGPVGLAKGAARTSAAKVPARDHYFLLVQRTQRPFNPISRCVRWRLHGPPGSNTAAAGDRDIR